MAEVIDLTAGSSSPPRDETRQARRERKREARRAREENGPKEEHGEPKEEPERKRKRDDSRERRRDARRSERARDPDSGKRSRRESPSDPDRKHSRRKKHRERERASPQIPDEQLFFVDESPAPLPTAALYAPAVPASETNELVLPAHVSVFGETPIDILAAAPDSDGDDYIEYLDYDNRKNFVRYYDDELEERRSKIVCKRCNAEDEHITMNCPVLICSTCGARDEHPTRSCNIGKICFSCGMKGHINTDCPNRYSRRNYDGCERCNSSSHQTSECPMIWRLYVYVEDAEQVGIVQARKVKKGVPLGQGGEGYIADDEWCYNCGGSGHWGDDCREFYHPEPIVEPTAFSYHFLSAGPFTLPPGSHAPRDWEKVIALPGDVGRRARKKEMEKLGRRAQQQEADEPDWFQNSRNVKSRGTPERNHRDRDRGRPTGNPPTGPRKMSFGQSVKDAGLPARPAPFQFTAGPSSSKVALSDRLTDPAQDRHRDAEALREEHKYRERNERRPRYKGGYSR
ncbi:hypothetical protein B0H17DRAFT_1048404 [Mycena rosella]|uniref:CCHC-type domain-containing protein n=1 Tax=Mycena rosella TaxID=1033263 RepID=A0AAD7DUH7_MYCRO|nr:hypothetical protein B0H17DRAFT_1048404 [Mycena rosella]